MKKLMKKEEFCAFLRSVPKAELHIHIEAVPTIQTIKTMYKRRFDKEFSDDEMKELFSYNDLNGFIKAFLQIQDMFVDESDFNYVFDDLASYLIDNNIVYCEAFFAPTAFLKKGFEYPKMIEVFHKRIAEIKKKHKITIKLLLDVSRTFGCENAMKNYELLKTYPCSDIIGIGLGGAEIKGPCRDFEAVYVQAKKDGFKVVAHAGEDVGPESVWEAIDILKAERIGHGISSVQDKKLVEELAKRKIPLEVCPTSNVFTKKYVQSIAEHPIRPLFDNGVIVTVNTDDPVFFKTTLIDEYYKLYSEANFSMEEIKHLIKNTFNSLFITPKKKKDFCALVDEKFV